MNEPIGFFGRFLLAFVAFFKTLFDEQFARGVRKMRFEGPERYLAPQVIAPPLVVAPPPQKPIVVAPPKPAEPVAPPKPDHREALHMLAILQRDGRLIDFLREDVTAFEDAEVGATARVVHAGCKKAIEGYMTLEPIYREPEGANVTLQRGFDASAVRVVGNVVGEPPFKGSLRHHGWRATKITLPPAPASADPTIVAPAEVELP